MNGGIFKFPHNKNFHFPSQVSTISQMNKMEKIASHIFVLFFIPVYFCNNSLYDFFSKKNYSKPLTVSHFLYQAWVQDHN
jgi:hypothetical protein